MSHPSGVVFPLVDGRRSTTATGRAVVADALRGADPVGAGSAERETNWRQGYVPHFRRLVEAGLPSAGMAQQIARDGLTSLHERMRWVPDESADDEPLDAAFAEASLRVGGRLDSETVRGSGTPERILSIPYAGQRLSGDALRERLAEWVDAGVIEPSCAEAVDLVIANPDWLDLSDRTVVVLGAAAEMGPLRSLLRWGADVAAVDLPRKDLWDRLIGDTSKLAGSITVPVRPGEGSIASRAGGDLVHDLGSVTDWVARLEGPITIGNYVYADGETNVRVSMAVDALTEQVVASKGRDDVALAFLATPTDVFAVPGEAVARSVANYAQRHTSKVVRVPLRTLSGGRLLRRNYVPGTDPGINDSVVSQQGPNYLLAKRLQRWRATAYRADGGLVSLKVAPPTRTRSVVKNRALAAAYAGAHRFGIEVFEPGTANTLMAALLVHDLRTGSPAQAHPWQDEAYAAAHGGLWTAAYDPRSALGIAALLGLASAR
ncbi:hypothetical protein N865_20925 [Intrasporangium oryzae NRRL B-24470]|uniref:Uncharacterized protein n=1 Tax=Intrasporangium oryzae NRRL B-24470 TaxID=1386089 RepID=W9G0X5_9MICO|nr:hypothetical protein [Intrasporangium oryzae]EWS99745.1 hypothetical protein N865_20925 [Intrasporangium oryzae NRRL B-24470]